MNYLKEDLICVMCEIVLKDPINLPCECLCCNEHLRDHFVNKNKITCPKCNREFEVSKEKFPTAHQSLISIINKESFLSKNEKDNKKTYRFLNYLKIFLINFSISN